MGANWHWLWPERKPSDDEESELMSRIHELENASAQRDEYGKYIAKHAKPAKHWFRKGK